MRSAPANETSVRRALCHFEEMIEGFRRQLLADLAHAGIITIAHGGQQLELGHHHAQGGLPVFAVRERLDGGIVR